MTHPLHALSDYWRQRAIEYEEDGAVVPADKLLRRCAADLERWVNEEITVAQAAEECPFLAESTIRNRLSSGALDNYGQPGAPLVRRGDLWGVPRRGLRAIDPAARRRIAGGR